MTRVKRGTIANKRRKNVLKHAKGFMWGRKSKYRLAKDALMHAWSYSYRDRRKKKTAFKRLWNVKIGAGTKEYALSYSKFIHALKKGKIEIDRKILANLAEHNPEVFHKIVKEAEKHLS